MNIAIELLARVSPLIYIVIQGDMLISLYLLYIG